MTKHDNKVYLAHILKAIQKIEDYAGGYSFEDFQNDGKTIDAVIRNFEIIGEASNNISEEFKVAHREVDFRPAISMRNWLAHGYDEIDLKIVWDAIKQDLPELAKQIKKI